MLLDVIYFNSGVINQKPRRIKNAKSIIDEIRPELKLLLGLIAGIPLAAICAVYLGYSGIHPFWALFTAGIIQLITAKIIEKKCSLKIATYSALFSVSLFILGILAFVSWLVSET